MSELDLEAIEVRMGRAIVSSDCYYCVLRTGDMPALIARVRELEEHNKVLAEQLGRCVHNLNERDLALQRIRLALKEGSER